MNLHFVRSIRGLQNFLVIPIMNTLAGFMIYIYIYIYISYTIAISHEWQSITCVSYLKTCSIGIRSCVTCAVVKPLQKAKTQT